MAHSRIDLHLHSRFSDGSDTVEELIAQLQKRSITCFALTDHDTVDGCEAMKNRLPAGMRFIPGVEFSAATAAGKCHILGLGIEPACSALAAVIDKGVRLRAEKAQVRLQHLETVHGIVFTEEELAYLHSLKSIGKPHFAAVLVARGMAPTIREAVTTYLNDCPVVRSNVTAAEAVAAIIAGGGIPIWAHPLGGETDRRLSADEFEARLQPLLAAGIRGLECYYSRYNRREIALLLDAAKRHDLLVSGGSDYHGTVKDIEIGTLSCDGLIPEEADLTVLKAID